jgi:protein TonB
MLIPKFDLYRKEWLDLVFADRNKQYGAYDLRIHYKRYIIASDGNNVFGHCCSNRNSKHYNA